MKLNKVIELPTGAVKFDGELSEDETKLVVELGLTFLMRSGALSVMSAEAAGMNKDVH